MAAYVAISEERGPSGYPAPGSSRRVTGRETGPQTGPQSGPETGRETRRDTGQESAGRGRRIAVVASADPALRASLTAALGELRWEVRPAAGGAEALERMAEASGVGTLVVDSWLPDLEVREFVRDLGVLYPGVDVLAIDGTDVGAPAARGSYRHEVLLALSRAQQSDEAAWAAAPTEAQILAEAAGHLGGGRAASRTADPIAGPIVSPAGSRAWPGPEHATSQQSAGDELRRAAGPGPSRAAAGPAANPLVTDLAAPAAEQGTGSRRLAEVSASPALRLPELIGTEAPMLEVSRRIRLVAPRSTPVLIQGATGTGKELVARALHRLSPRAAKPFVALNCAAIPEALLESELFGHTRGAFTGAVQGRTGRIEAAAGGTLFLDEIGEMPLALQAKLLRFVECGEIQRVGENEPVRVDVRIVAATHRRLGRMAEEGSFRADLFYRLSVFLIRTPSLAGHLADVPLLVGHFLRRMGQAEPQKQLSDGAMARLLAHSWPGNVRELEHVLERAWILAEDRPLIDAAEIDFGGEDTEAW